MSYILEGLKKLEQKRQGNTGLQGSLAARKNVASVPEKKPVWPYLLVAILIVNTAAIAWWVHVSRSGKTYEPIAERSVLAHEQAVRPDVTVLHDSVASGEKRETPDPTLLQKQEDHTKILEEKPVRKPLSLREKTATQPQESMIEDYIDANEHQPMKAREKYLTYSQLPDNVKKSLPEMKMFLYSPERKKRFVQINDLLLREGESRPDGLKVLQISAQAVFFSYQGYRFQMKTGDK